MTYTKLETYKTSGYTSTDAKKRKHVVSSEYKAENAADTINPKEVEAKVSEIEELMRSTDTELKNRINTCIENSGSETLNVNQNTYEPIFEELSTNFDLSSFNSELENCITEVDKKFNELQENNNEIAKQASIDDCTQQGGIYHRSTITVESVDAF